MSSTLSFCFIAAAVLALAVFAVSYKTGHFIKSVLLSALSGIGAIFAVNILTPITGVAIAVNYISLALGGIFGIPGVIALLFMH
ncbi:MAG: pro-sigmaK processing inhibitor BofA family protein [Clostridia bacterium]|nr:pro-sigmaK processing inhibitor BofA family protein [Clostridia bacterium]